MTSLADLIVFLRELAPLELAEEWDNVGLLLGRSDGELSAVLTCLTLTPDVAQEAIEKNAELIVSHHPILFRPVQSLTDDFTEGKMLLDLIRAGIAVYSPHTAYDSARTGINSQLAETFGLSGVQPLRPVSAEQLARCPHLAGLGAGRIGTLPIACSLEELAQQVREKLPVSAGVQLVGESDRSIRTVAIACGSAAEMIQDAAGAGADVLITGEARFHACLEARSLGIGLIVAGHYATERPGIEHLARCLTREFSSLTVFASEAETDPLRLLPPRTC
ncbi:MAG TPA: Nif3-like dinuclear metal center hexameric protein [Planctomycetaceae bacterium]|nr:Nif3-like dinuclear metal center hexameric protein [Planctomycetaceae bacterium]